ncbi:lysophosphatidic acid receptor 2-like [Xiphophorus couchianus]|uniref:lysophosphatidic acid receptor 2-like n=1 Tax=Xiphophorus couchianus TaxID=32473 RepID=UPI00101622A9|nr:lysophosphatidic acid receptor 2-like [Xiphophorus couchianus]
MSSTNSSVTVCYYNETVEFFYNNSNKTIAPFWRKRDYAVVSLGLLVCFIVIFSNLLVIFAIFKNRRFHFPIYYLLGNLAVSDLFSGLAYLHLMFHTGPWTIRLSQYQWFVRQGLIDTSLTASVLNLLAIAMERHQTIFNMQLHSEMSTRRVFIIIFFIWMVSIIMGLFPTMGWNCLCDLERCSTMAPLYSRSFLVFWALTNLITFSIMVAVYTRIFFYVRHKSRQMSEHTTPARHRETVLGLMKTVSMILGLFVLCWTPGLVLLMLDGLYCETCLVLNYEKYFLVLAECNSFVNPIIYCFRDKDMRKTFKELLCCLCRRGKGPSDNDFTTLEESRLRTIRKATKTNGTPLMNHVSEDHAAASDGFH